jgi:hypothetical protein
MVRKGGLEPPRLTAPDPKSGASANSATFARDDDIRSLHHIAETTVHGRNSQSHNLKFR